MKKLIYSLLAVFACQYLTAQLNLTIDTIPSGPDSASLSINLIGQPNNLGGGHDVTLVAGGTSRFEAHLGAISYAWSPAFGLSDTTVSNPFVTVNSTTSYTVRIQTGTDTNYYTVRAIVITPPTTSAASCNNWVTNGDFEAASGCTNTVSNLNWQTNWYNAGGSCDFYTACNTPYVYHSWWGVAYSYDYVTYPASVTGYQTSSSYGNAYAGLIATTYGSGYPYFEYTQSVLPCSLVIGQKYKMQFDASWAGQSNFTCGNIGMLVTTNAIAANPNGTQIIATPQVDGSCGTNQSWTTYTNTYTGAGEQYVTIGNFDAAPNACPRFSNNTFPEPPLTISDPPDDYTYNFIDNIIITPMTPTVSIQHNGGVYCAGIATTFTLQESGSPGNICSWSGPYGFSATGSIVHGTVPPVAGTYVYTVTVNLGASCNLCGNLTNTISLVVLPTVAGGSTLTVTAPPTPACADPVSGLGTVFLQASGGGNASGSYVWNPNVNTYQNSSHSHAFALVPAGVYSYSVTIASVSAGYCTDMGSTTFTVNPAPTFSLSSSSPIICKYQTSTTLTASDPSLTYTWTPAAGLSSTHGTSVVANPTVTTIYYVTATNTVTGCTSTTNSITVNVTGPSSININASPTLCIGSTETVTLHPPANATVGYTVTPLGIIIPPTNAVTSFTFAPTVTTTYTVTEANQNGCLYSYPLSVTVNPLPTISVTSSTTMICPNANFTLTATGASTSTNYTWSPSITTHTSTEVVHENATTTYTVIGKGTNGCPNTATVTVTANPAPAAPTLSGILCSNIIDNVIVTNVDPNDTYSWTGGTGSSTVTCNPSTPSCTDVNINNPSGNYYVTATNTLGCSTKTMISAIAGVSASINSTPSLTYCANNPHVITLSVPSSGTYSWTNTGQTVSTITVEPTSTTVYTVTVGSIYYACTKQATVTVTVNQPPTLTLTASSQTVCPGQSVILTASGANTPTSYTWSANHPPSLSTIHTSTVAVTPTVTTTYIVTGGGAVSGCNSSSSITIYVDQVPVPALSGTLCTASTNTIAVTNPGSNNYSWNPSSSVTCSTTACSTVTITNPTGIYTVTATDGLGCTSKTTITTKAAPNVTVTPPSSSYCGSAAHAITLTGHNANSYTWSSNAGSVTTATASIPPLGATDVFTVTGTNALGCSASATATINVISAQSITITPSADPICSGTNAMLTASGATTYTWTGTAGSGINGTNHNATTITTPNLTANATYTLTGTVGTGTAACKASTVLTLTVNTPPTVSFSITTSGNCSSTSTVVCSGDPVTITANSSTATDYTWTPGNLNGNPVTVSPTSTTIYTVVASDGICVSTSTTSIVVGNCTAGLGHSVTTGTVSNQNIFIANSFTLTGSLTFLNCNVSIAPNVTITIPSASGFALTIDNTHFKALSNTMWQGIVVNPGGAVKVQNNSLIEDAIVAIDNNPTSVIQSGQVSTIRVSNSVFNCNRTAVREAFYQSSNQSAYTPTSFAINNSVITCRCGITYPVTMSTLNTYVGNITSPDLTDYYSVANFTAATLKTPYAGQPAYEGVHLENNGVQGTNSSSIPLPYMFSIGNLGTGNLVLFDNLTYGVNAINTTFSVTASAFQMPQLSNSGGIFSIPSIGGYGVLANVTTSDWYCGIYVDNSRFIRMIKGIQNINYYDINLNSNTMFSRQTIPTSVGTSLIPLEGGTGMYSKSVRFQRAIMNSNNIVNINNGINFVIDQSSVNGGNGEYVSDITVNSNTFDKQFANTQPNTYVGNAIVVNNVITPTATTTTGPAAGSGSKIYVQNNTINNVFRGILLSNHKFQEVRDENNTITMLSEPSIFGTPTTQYGIQHVLTGATPPPGFSTIYNNNVTGISSGSTSQSAFDEAKIGIWVNRTSYHYVTCNNVVNAGRGFEFSGPHVKLNWRLNNITNCGEGLALAGPTGATNMGNGSSGQTNDACDNQWSGSTYGDTYTDANSLPSNSPLYVQYSSLPYGPINNQTAFVAYSLSNGIIQPNSPSYTYLCGNVIAGRQQNPNARNAQSNNSVSNTATDISLLEQIAQDSLQYVNDSTQNDFINKNMVYQSLAQDNTLMDSSTVLQNFYTANQATYRHTYCVIEDSLHTGNYSYAASLVSTLTPSSLIEQNYQRFYQIYINNKLGTGTASDTTDLETLASSCPLLSGMVVLQARSFHNSMYNDFKHYEDNCPQGKTDNNRISKNKNSLLVNKLASLYVYPNPSMGRVYISGFDGNQKTAVIEITDVTGKLIYKQQNNLSNGMVELNLPFANGVYFVHAVNQSGVMQIQKLVITN